MSENDENPKLLEASIETVIASQGHDIGTRILQKIEAPAPSIFDSATVIRPSPLSTDSLPAFSPSEERPQTVVTSVQETVVTKSKRKNSQFFRRCYASLNDLTSLSHWTGRFVWIIASSALAFMIYLNTATVQPTVTPIPVAAKPKVQALPIPQPVARPVASIETSARPRMKVEFLVHLHELIDKSQSFAPDYAP